MNSLRRRSAPSVRMPSLPTPLPAIDTGRLRDPAYTVTVSKTRHARPALVRTRRPPSDQPAVSRDQPCSKPPSTSACFSSGSGSAPSGQIGCQGLEVVFPAADSVTGHPAHYQDDANHQHNNADRPDDGNLRDEPDNQQDETENNQLWLLAIVTIVSPCLT